MQLEKVRVFMLEKLKRELTGNLLYHGPGHVQDVYDAALHLAALENLNDEDRTLLLTAALFHDSGFIVARTNHEQISCSIAQQVLPDFGYSAGQIAVICTLIMATHIPQTPHSKLEEIICDADLDYLGRDDFFTLGTRLFTELSSAGLIQGEVAWNHLQVSFLENHRYFTASARRLRDQKKAENLALVKLKIQ